MSNSPELTHVRHGASVDTFAGIVRDNHHVARFVLKMPHELVDNHGIQFAPGFTDGTVGPDYITNYLADNGRAAYAIDHPRTDDTDSISDPEGQKSRTLYLVTDFIRNYFKLDEEVDSVGHSEGGGNSTRLALEHPDMVRSVTVMASGGLIENDSQAKIIKRSLSRGARLHRDKLWEHIKNPVRELKIISSSIGYVASNPQKAVREALAISCHDIRYRFPLLQAMGIKSAALQFGGDELFWLSLVNESTDNGSIFDKYTVYPHDLNAGHLTPQFHPRKVGKIVLDGINEMLSSNIQTNNSELQIENTEFCNDLSEAS